MIMYFGSKLSDNQVKTPEGYLICKNVPIGRTGYMDYLGEELGLDDKQGQIVKVYRSPEELFSKATIASFEGKSATNNHPSKNITLDTVGFIEKGHVENVRQDGDFLVADLFIKDAELIKEIENGKREVSCGYDCLWVPIEGTDKYEQKQIVGNHVAIVQNGRAGSHVSIKDEDSITIKKQTGGKKMAKQKISQKMLAAIGFQHFVKDAEPEDVADALDALNEEKAAAEDDDVPATNEVEDDGEEDVNQKILAAIGQLDEKINDIVSRVSALEEGEQGEGTADDDLDGLENELSDEDIDEDVQDDDVDAEETQDDDEAETVEASDDAEELQDDEEDLKNAASDSAKFLKLVKDMKPMIMAIEDRETRDNLAKSFAKSVRDARAVASSGNGYGKILKTTNSNKKGLMDESSMKRQSVEQGTQLSANAWNKQNAFYKEKGGI